MATIEHRTFTHDVCEEHGQIDCANCHFWRKPHGPVDFVTLPAADYRGAVEERDKLVADLRDLADRLANIGADQAAEEVGVLVTAYGGR